MTKIHYDYSKIQSNVEPAISSAISNLRSCSTRMVIPNNFRYKSFLSSLSTTLNTCRSSLSGIQRGLNTAKRNYESVEDTAISDLNTINLSIDSRG